MHKCKAAMVCCIDFRFQDDMRMFIEEQGLGGNVDLISVPGGVKDEELVMRFLELSKKLHGIKKVYLVNHQDCGAYGPEIAADPVRELEVHTKDLLSLKAKLQEKYQGVEVAAFFLDLDKNFNEINPKNEQEES